MRTKSLVVLSAAMLYLFAAGPALAAKVLVIPSDIPFAKGLDVPDAVKTECTLGVKISDFIREYAKGDFDKITHEKSSEKDALVLTMEIYDIEGRSGGAWSGAKKLGVRGELKQGGKVVGSFKALRYSGGGAFGGYKGTCSILGRCTKALGEDIANFVKHPSMDARLGDL